MQVGLLNVDGYYDSLLSFIDKAVEEGFISPNARQIIISAPTAKELVKKLEVTSQLAFLDASKRKKHINCIVAIVVCLQEYSPCHESVASKICWEIERIGYSSED